MLHISSFQNGLIFPPISNGCWVMTCHSWLLRELFAENVWKNWLKNWLCVSGNLIPAAPDHSWSPFLAWWSYFMSFTNVIWDFLRFWVFDTFFGRIRSKNWLFFSKKPIFLTSRPQKRTKISKSQKKTKYRL